MVDCGWLSECHPHFGTPHGLNYFHFGREQNGSGFIHRQRKSVGVGEGIGWLVINPLAKSVRGSNGCGLQLKTAGTDAVGTR
jgi:hypothetical protein